MCMAKGGRESAKSLQAAILTLEQYPPERIFLCTLKKSSQLRAAATRPCRLSTPLCHTYSEPSGHEGSPGGTQNIPYLFKKLSKSRLSDPFFGLFLVISEVGSQIYIANLAIFNI